MRNSGIFKIDADDFWFQTSGFLAASVLRNGGTGDLLLQEEAFYGRISDGATIAGLEDIEGCFYVRLSVQDKPGVLAKVTEVLANAEISISTVEQTTNPVTDTANLILTTHKTTEKAMSGAIDRLHAEPAVLNPPVLMRIFEPVQA